MIKKEILFPDLIERNIYINKDIDTDTYFNIENSINTILMNDDNIYQNHKKLLTNYLNINIDLESLPDYYKPVNITINSYGGEVYYGLSIYDIIENLNKHCQVNMIGKGIIASCAFCIFLAAKKENRVCTKNAIFMVHQVSSGAIGPIKEMQECVDQTKSLNDRIFDIITSNTSITKEQLQNIYDKKVDWYIDANKALELGIISKIIE